MRTFLLVLWLLPAAALLSGSAAAPAAGTAPADTAPADTVRLGLTEAIATSLEASPEVDQREAQRDRAASRAEEARANRFLTDLSLNTAHSFAPGLEIPESNTRPTDEYYLNPDIENDWSPGELRFFNRFEVAARQPILTWGELSGSIKAASEAVDVEAAGVERKTLEVAARTGELYYNVLLTRALDRLAARTRDVIDRAKREVQRLLDEGDESVDQADLFQVRLTEQEYRRRVVEINQRSATAQSALRRQLFLPDSQTVVPATDELSPIRFSIHPDSLSYYIDLAVANRPELRQARAGIAARRAQVEVEKSDYYPKLGFQATYGFSYTMPERPRQRNAFIGDSYRGSSTRTGFGLQMNLNFSQTRARVEQARAQLNEVRHQQEAAGQLVRFEVEQAFRDLIVARSDLESRDRDVTITGEWLRTEQINFDLDFGDTENLVKAVRANLEAEARYFEAVKRYNVAVLRLLDATGTLADRVRRGTLIETSPSPSGGE